MRAIRFPVLWDSRFVLWRLSAPGREKHTRPVFQGGK
jgi:hypothetical protein